jgi:hypothetical protein
MPRIKKAVLAQITAEYAPLVGSVANPGRMAFFYGAQKVLLVKVGGSSWFLPINKGRQSRPVNDALEAILTETKVGKKIVHRAERMLFLEQAANKKVRDDKVRASMLTEMAIEMRTLKKVKLPA